MGTIIIIHNICAKYRWTLLSQISRMSLHLQKLNHKYLVRYVDLNVCIRYTRNWSIQECTVTVTSEFMEKKCYQGYRIQCIIQSTQSFPKSLFIDTSRILYCCIIDYEAHRPGSKVIKKPVHISRDVLQPGTYVVWPATTIPRMGQGPRMWDSRIRPDYVLSTINQLQ